MRLISDAMINALAKPSPQIFRAVRIFFPSGELRLWTGRNTRMINGLWFIGGGSALQFGEIEETGNIEATGTQITLSGIDKALLATALDEPYQGSTVRIYLGERSVADDMVEIGTGKLDQMLIDDDPAFTTIHATVENILVDPERPRIMRYTHEDQQLIHPGDMVFEFVADIQDKAINW